MVIAAAGLKYGMTEDSRLHQFQTPSIKISFCMTFISVTRLRLRSFWFLPSFVITNESAVRQLKQASGFIKGLLLVDRHLTFWTLTAWESEQAMRAYRNNGAHLKAMPKLMNWCDEAHAAHWSQEGSDLPDWNESYSRITAPDARVSKVKHPSKDHLTKTVPPPRYPSKLERPLLPQK
jgi:hypothetical protein